MNNLSLQFKSCKLEQEYLQIERQYQLLLHKFASVFICFICLLYFIDSYIKTNMKMIPYAILFTLSVAQFIYVRISGAVKVTILVHITNIILCCIPQFLDVIEPEEDPIQFYVQGFVVNTIHTCLLIDTNFISNCLVSFVIASVNVLSLSILQNKFDSRLLGLMPCILLTLYKLHEDQIAQRKAFLYQRKDSLLFRVLQETVKDPFIVAKYELTKDGLLALAQTNDLSVRQFQVKCDGSMRNLFRRLKCNEEGVNLEKFIYRILDSKANNFQHKTQVYDTLQGVNYKVTLYRFETTLQKIFVLMERVATQKTVQFQTIQKNLQLVTYNLTQVFIRRILKLKHCNKILQSSMDAKSLNSITLLENISLYLGPRQKLSLSLINLSKLFNQMRSKYPSTVYGNLKQITSDKISLISLTVNIMSLFHSINHQYRNVNVYITYIDTSLFTMSYSGHDFNTNQKKNLFYSDPLVQMRFTCKTPYTIFNKVVPEVSLFNQGLDQMIRRQSLINKLVSIIGPVNKADFSYNASTNQTEIELYLYYDLKKTHLSDLNSCKGQIDLKI